MSIKCPGNHFHRALAFAHAVCPKAEGKEAMAHLVFIENRIVASDGEAYHIGMLPDDAGFKAPLVATRLSVDDLLLALAFAGRVARAHSRDFTVVMDGNEVEIRYGAKRSIVYELEPCDVGEIPKKWVEPVSKNAPLVWPSAKWRALAARASKLGWDEKRIDEEVEKLGLEIDSPLPELDAGKMRRAMSWHRSWEKDVGAFTWRYNGSGWVRLDIAAEGEHVAAAFLLPTSSVPAQLPPDEPLLAHGKKVPHGRSILNLSLDIGAPEVAEPPAEPKRRRNGKRVEPEETPDGEAGAD